ncbi:unnamed protein product [Eruca vesicaria subsp. sativa]|uniref:Uncharacterized protein n=1 Tax=Eruca vesicaria subsp. sativa TaxID=29727 RepID=A0ABC8M091_ERUVS|nr:unnamed protein product [Eruca vesicaria subsp. sativa]
MAPSTATSNQNRRRPRTPESDPPDLRHRRAQMPNTSGPSSMSPAYVPGAVPPGVVPPGASPQAAANSSTAASAAPAPYVRRREDALLRAPSRRNQQHLHPELLNGAICQNDSTADTPTSRRLLLNQEYIKRGLTHKGTIYGLGSVQYKNDTPSVPVQVTLQRNLDVEMRLCSVETTVAEFKAEICGMKTEFKEEMSAARASMDMILQVLLSQGLQPRVFVPTASTTQPSQPQAQP